MLLLCLLCCLLGFFFRRRRRPHASPIPKKDYSIDKENPAYGMAAGPTGRGGVGAVKNEVYSAVQPVRSDSTYVDIAPEPQKSDPVYGTAVFRRGTGVLGNSTYAGASVHNSRDVGAVANATYAQSEGVNPSRGVLANGVYVTTTPGESASDHDRDTEAATSHFYPAEGAVAAVHVAPAEANAGVIARKKNGLTANAPFAEPARSPVYAEAQFFGDKGSAGTAEEPLYAEAPLAGATGNLSRSPSDGEPTYAEAPVGGLESDGPTSADSPATTSETRNPSLEADEPTYAEGPVFGSPNTSQYDVPMKFAGTPGATVHYTADAPLYLEQPGASTGPTYMEAAEADESEYMQSNPSDGVSRAGSLAQRRQGSKSAVVPSPLALTNDAALLASPISPGRHFDEDAVHEVSDVPVTMAETPDFTTQSRRASITSVTSRASMV